MFGEQLRAEKLSLDNNYSNIKITQMNDKVNNFNKVTRTLVITQGPVFNFHFHTSLVTATTNFANKVRSSSPPTYIVNIDIENDPPCA